MARKTKIIKECDFTLFLLEKIKQIEYKKNLISGFIKYKF